MSRRGNFLLLSFASSRLELLAALVLLASLLDRLEAVVILRHSSLNGPVSGRNETTILVRTGAKRQSRTSLVSASSAEILADENDVLVVAVRGSGGRYAFGFIGRRGKGRRPHVVTQPVWLYEISGMFRREVRPF